jgi:hypothetical protein
MNVVKCGDAHCRAGFHVFESSPGIVPFCNDKRVNLPVSITAFSLQAQKLKGERMRIILADEWSGLFQPFMPFLFVAVALVGLAIGAVTGLVSAAFIRILTSRSRGSRDRASATRRMVSRKLWQLTIWTGGGSILGLILAWVFRDSIRSGPMVTAWLTEKELFGLCFFVPLGAGAGSATGAGLYARSSS